MQPVDYYQIGGFQAHLRENSSDALADRLLASSRDGGEYVLGILPNGASYLLLPGRAFRERRFRRPYQDPKSAQQFESLSPIQFANKRELVAKLKMLESNKKSSDGPRDRSKANTEYTAGGEAWSEAGLARASFEHQRVFYRLCQNTIPNPRDYALNPGPWFPNVRIYSFAFNLWSSDLRSLEDRLADPRVLDVGWTEFDAPTDSDDLRAVSTTHLALEENRILMNKGRTRLTLPDISQVMPQASIAKLLQDLFATDRDGERKPPKLLLVHDEATTRHVLRSFGVDADSLRWVKGIKELLYCPLPARGYDRATAEQDTKSYDAREPRDRNLKWSRNRSRSPRRRPEDQRHIRSRSPPPRVDPPSVYVVDVRQMYHYLMLTPTSNETVPSIAKALNVRDTAMARGEDDQMVYEDIDPKHWCAGRESRLLGYTWEEMANSLSIDEQRARRQGYAREDPIEPAGRSIAAIAAYDDGDMDPNDIIQPMAQSASALRTAAKPVGMYDSEEEDDDWY
ncbi:hypothetical protein OH76DRAFT_1395511 [Lentinus brumalis]|uniref:Uncharacterized protein n=1 Tax=Lentinus brumalis TaxID=2498619 RepID=A0A371DV15_9APHY|nr:hypothetical protein OH76DRAFT_1395511 [Polyporus brumalis]